MTDARPEHAARGRGRARPAALPPAEAEIHDRYVALLAESSLAASTRQKYSGSVHGYLAWLADRHPDAPAVACSLPADALSAYREHLRSLGRSSPAINAGLTAVSDLYRRLGVEVARPPSAGLRPRAVVTLDPAQRKRYLGVLTHRSNRDRAIGLLPLHCGLRISEIVRLDRDDLDLSAAPSIVGIRPDRSPAVPRRVPMTTDVRSAVAAWLGERAAISTIDTALFVDAGGRRLGEHTARQIVATIAAEAGLLGRTTPFRPTHLRHSYAVARLGEEHSITQVAAWLGISEREAVKTYATFLAMEASAAPPHGGSLGRFVRG